MTRVKRGTTASKRRKNVLSQAKGFRWGRKNKYKQAKEALAHAYTYAYRDRKVKKREKRQLWQAQINAAARLNEMTYSKLMDKLHKNNVEIDRKILAQLAQEYPDIFEKIVKE
jgi:large subunit ribosomal protein L20